MLSIKSLGSPFDFDGDGRLNIAEQSAEMMALFDNPFEEKTKTRREEIEEALEELGYSFEDLRDMDPEEIREILEDAGIDPD